MVSFIGWLSLNSYASSKFVSAGCLFEKKLCPRDQLCNDGEYQLFNPNSYNTLDP